MSRPEMIITIKDNKNNTRIDILSIYGGYDTFSPVDDKDRILTHDTLTEWENRFKEELELTKMKMFFIEKGNDDPDVLYEQWKDEKYEADYLESILHYIETLHQIVESIAYCGNPELEIIYWFSY